MFILKSIKKWSQFNAYLKQFHIASKIATIGDQQFIELSYSVFFLESRWDFR